MSMDLTFVNGFDKCFEHLYSTKSLCEHIFLFLLGKYLGLKQLGHMVNKYLTVQETAKTLSKGAIPLDIPTMSFSCSSFSSTVSMVSLFISAILDCTE